MRQIKYILIKESLPENSPGVPRIRRDCKSGYHYIVDSEGVVRNPIDIRQTGAIFPGDTLDQRDYNAFSIGILYKGSFAEEFKQPKYNEPVEPPTSQHRALVKLIVHLRMRFPEAKILGVSEIDGKGIKPDAYMNRLRRELSEKP